jgi:type IV fimbrial biogenesis protein FimT
LLEKFFVNYIQHMGPMKHKQFGFTLLELLVAVAIAGILATLAAPSFRTLLVRRSVQTAAESLVADMRLARSEALKRSTRTVICKSTNGANCDAAGVDNNWRVGWIVFVDMNSDGLFTAASAGVAGDELIKVQQTLPNIATIQQDVTPSNTRAIFRFEPTGWAKAASQSFNITPIGSATGDATTRLVCVSNNGRPSLRVEGTSACN